MSKQKIVCYISHTKIFPLYIPDTWSPKTQYVPIKTFLSSIPTTTIPTTPSTHTPLPPIPPVIPIKKPAQPIQKLDMTPAEQSDFIKTQVLSDENFPQDIPILKEKIGKSDLMHPRTYAAFHEATPLLHDYAKNGCPVDCGPDWTMETILKLLRRGPHRSSKKRDAVRQLRRETTEKIACGYARTVRWGDIVHNIPPKLKISPVAMIPHKSKKYRCILDLSFTLYEGGKSYPSVNDTTNRLAKPEAMTQLGNCLKRIVASMADNFDKNRPFMFCKLDIKDGFWRMRVSDDDAWNFAYVLPSLKDNIAEDDIELVIPNSLQMGWCESPPFFCSGSETARDVIEQIMERPDLPTHRFIDIMLKEFIDQNVPPCAGNTTLFEVFVDDFVCATNQLSHQWLDKISKAMIHGIHSIFPPPEITGHPGGDPVSEKKLDKGEGVWSFHKEILGWDFHGDDYTLQLPPKKCDAIVKLIRDTLLLPRASLNKYQKIAGKLQHASFGIPCGRALFSPLQHAMRSNPSFVNLTPELKQILSDWQYIITYMKNHPSSVLQLVTNLPDYVGNSDACALGAGGVWFSGLKNLPQPFLWQVPWPEDIRSNLVSESNPNGTLTINDLELAGLVLNWLALECQPDLQLTFHHIGVFCDNTSAVSWAYKLRTSTSIVAGRLLRLLGLRMHARKTSSLVPLHIAGDDNTMADIVSRAFKTGKFFIANACLVTYFNHHFPLPQKRSWKELQFPKGLVSRVISCLRGELLPMASLLRLPGIGKNIGHTGAITPPSSSVILSSQTKTHSTASTWSADSPPESGPALSVEDVRSKFRAAPTLSRPSTRPFNWLDNKLPFTRRSRNIN
jgi:hypothetical protein